MPNGLKMQRMPPPTTTGGRVRRTAAMWSIGDRRVTAIESAPLGCAQPHIAIAGLALELPEALPGQPAREERAAATHDPMGGEGGERDPRNPAGERHE